MYASFYENKKRQIVSRVLFTSSKKELAVYHFSSLNFTIEIYQPTLRDRASSSQASVYMVFQFVRFTLPYLSPNMRWALTPPFHLFLQKKVVFLSAALSVLKSVNSLDLPVRKYDALHCPDFPLFRLHETAINRFARIKLRKLVLNYLNYSRRIPKGKF